MHLSEIVIGYGMTETSPASFASATDDTLERRVSTVGRVLPPVEAKVVDTEGRIVPRHGRRIADARLSGHARLLERRREDPLSDRRGRVDAYR
jgi:acyl-CoA synthetase (AMP-forming)/AMP-acid ligase II